jgi:hypothetical protein
LTEGLHDLHSPSHIIRAIKSSRIRWAGHVACTAKKKDAYRVLVEKPERKRPTGRPTCRWENNIKMHLQVIKW